MGQTKELEDEASGHTKARDMILINTRTDGKYFIIVTSLGERKVLLPRKDFLALELKTHSASHLLRHRLTRGALVGASVRRCRWLRIPKLLLPTREGRCSEPQ